MLSLNILLGKYPPEAYTELAFEYLCNSFPSVPDTNIKQYFNNYNNLLIPTVRGFRKVLNLNGSEIPPANPLPTDPAYAADIQIINDKEREKEYIQRYVTILDKLKKCSMIICGICKKSKPDITCFSCSNGHTVCYLCFERMVKQILRASGRVLVCNCSDEGCSGVFSTQVVKSILEPELCAQLVERGVFGLSSSSFSYSSFTSPSPPPPPSVLPPLPPPRQKPVIPAKPKSPLPDYLREMTAEEEDAEGYVCLITRKIMKDPVVCQDGYTYDRATILAFVNTFRMSPMTFQDADPAQFIVEPDKESKRKIQEYLIYNPGRDPDAETKA